MLPCPVPTTLYAFALTPASGPASQARYLQESTQKLSYFTYNVFTVMLKVFFNLGISPGDHCIHSFCIGHASCAIEAGVHLQAIPYWVIGNLMLFISTSTCMCLSILPAS